MFLRISGEDSTPDVDDELMSEPKPLPALESFRATLKKGNMPDDYPPEALAMLALDLRAAEAFVKTPEGALSLGVFKMDRPSNQFNADNAWTSLSPEQKLALAKIIGRYREGHKPEGPSRKLTAVDLPDLSGIKPRM